MRGIGHPGRGWGLSGEKLYHPWVSSPSREHTRISRAPRKTKKMLRVSTISLRLIFDHRVQPAPNASHHERSWSVLLSENTLPLALQGMDISRSLHEMTYASASAIFLAEFKAVSLQACYIMQIAKPISRGFPKPMHGEATDATKATHIRIPPLRNINLSHYL